MIAWTLLFLLLAPVLASAQLAEVGPLDEEYPLVREMERRGPADAPSEIARELEAWGNGSVLPHALGIGVRPYLTLFGRGTDPQRQLAPDFLDLRSGDAVDPAWRARYGAVVGARLMPRLVARLRFAFDTEGINDPLNRTRDFDQLDASNNFDEAWIGYDGERASVQLGRVPIAWGPERNGGLLLSATAPAVDMLRGTLRWGPHRLETFAGQLSSDPLDDGAGLRRWLYGHRLDLWFRDRTLRVGLSETALLAGEGEGLNLRYLNPIPLWAQIQVEQDNEVARQANVFDMVDAEAYVGIGEWALRTYGSVVVDDVQISGEGRDRDPDQIAWSAGVDLCAGAASRWLFGYEYRRLGSWTYIHRGEGTDYQHYERPLGAPEGPDTDRHDLRADFRPAKGWALSLVGERRRRGKNRLSTDDPREGNVHVPFPFGTVEKRWTVATGLSWSRPPYAKAALWAALHSIENVNNVSGVDEDIFEVRFALHLRAPVWRALVD